MATRKKKKENSLKIPENITNELFLLVLIRPEEVKTGSPKLHLRSAYASWSGEHNRDVDITKGGTGKFSERYLP